MQILKSPSAEVCFHKVRLHQCFLSRKRQCLQSSLLTLHTLEMFVLLLLLFLLVFIMLKVAAVVMDLLNVVYTALYLCCYFYISSDTIISLLISVWLSY